MSGYESAIIVMAFGYLTISKLPWVARQIGDAVAEFHASRLRGEQILMRRIALQESRGTRANGNTREPEHQFQTAQPSEV
jgi:Sec-independent protein translocase protein TatA